MKRTELGKSYWDETGAYQLDFDMLTKQLMPPNGEAETVNGELIRAVNRLYYEYCNNGNCNACEIEYGEEEVLNDIWCEEEEDYISEWELEEVEVGADVSEFYMGFIDLIKQYVKPAVEVMDKIIWFIRGNNYSCNNQFSDENMALYDEMVDHVMFYILNNIDDKTSYESGN